MMIRERMCSLVRPFEGGGVIEGSFGCRSPRMTRLSPIVQMKPQLSLVRSKSDHWSENTSIVNWASFRSAWPYSFKGRSILCIDAIREHCSNGSIPYCGIFSNFVKMSWIRIGEREQLKRNSEKSVEYSKTSAVLLTTASRCNISC